MQSEAFMKQTFMDENIVQTMKLWQKVDAQITVDQMEKALGKRVANTSNIDDLLANMDESELAKTMQNLTCNIEIA